MANESSNPPQSRPLNSLANETSPYLLQHADNPVQWFPWGHEALEKAQQENKPILLSIGYSACHWCHVMAHESFEDEATAQLMNEHFINVKVDREERPDIDKIYQLSHQLLTQRSGGWPLTMFLTPHDQTPFFGGTYFPPAPRHGMPAFRDLLLRIIDFLADNPDEIRNQNQALRDALSRAEGSEEPGSKGQLNEAALSAARNALESVFDAEHGGFGGAPKFPHPTNIERLLRYYAQSHRAGRADRAALHIALHTLNKMADGGIYDHVGGGFCRYSVDAEWMIPHFEKMLYDNGPLLYQYATAWQLTRDPKYKSVVTDTRDWVIREMSSPEGGFYSSLDADSEGEEGKFYVWDANEVTALLPPDELALWSRTYGLEEPPNFEGQRWHFHTFADAAETANDLGHSVERAQQLFRSARQKLFQARCRRIRPGRDEKILTSWNALMITGLATAGRVFGDATSVAAAEAAMGFLRETMWSDGRLWATFKDGRAHLDAYLDDYAFTIEASLALLQIRWHRPDLEFAVALAEVLLDQFEDKAQGGFFFTANDHEKLIHRSKSFMDDALPAGNGVACIALQRLGHLLGETRYLDAAERALLASAPSLIKYPHAHNAMLTALEEYLSPPQTIILRGSNAALAPWARLAAANFAIGRSVFSIPSDTPDLPGVLGERSPRGALTAYVCEGHQCLAPITEEAELRTALVRSEIPHL